MKALITMLIVFTISTSFAFSQFVFDSCLVGWYPFNGNTLDESGNGNNATLNGASLTTDRNGQVNKAYAFDGDNDYIDLNNDFDLQYRTVNIWFNAYMISTTRVIYDSDHSGLQYGKIGLSVSDASGFDKINFPRGGSFGHSEPVTENQWHMATFVTAQDTTWFYLDGLCLDSIVSPYTNSPNGNSTAIVGSSRLLDRYFLGLIDDIRIYNCSLSKPEIAQLFNPTTNTDQLLSSTVSVHPSPSEGTVYLDYPPEFETGGKLNVFDVFGSQVAQMPAKRSMDLGFLANGIYFIRFSHGEKSFVRKVIINK